MKTNANTQSQDEVSVGLSTTPNTAAKDLDAMLSAGNTAATDKTQVSSSGTDTFGSLLSDHMTQDVAYRHADAQPAVDDAGRRADVAHKDATRTNAASNDQDAKPADGNTPMPSITTPAASTADTTTVKQSQPVSTKDFGTAAKQAVADPAAQLVAQIGTTRQAAQQAVAVQLPVALPATPSASNTDTDAASSTASKSPVNGAAILAAASAAANGARGSADPATMAQAGLAGLPVTKDAKANAANTPTPPATVLLDNGTLAQAVAHTHVTADNTLVTVRQLNSASSRQGADADRGLPRRGPSPYNTPAQPVAVAVADAISHASNGDNTGSTDSAGTQLSAQGNDTQFQGMLSHTTGDGGTAVPIFAAGGTNAGVVAGASITPQQARTLPTFGDTVQPQGMASQLAFMQVHRQSSAELQLNPAELGGMYARPEVDNGAVSMSSVCQHQAVVKLIQDAMPHLCDAMQQGGVQLAQTSVNADDFSQQQNVSQGPSAQNQSSGSGNGGSGSRYGSSDSQDRPGTVTAASRRTPNHGGAIDTFT